MDPVNSPEDNTSEENSKQPFKGESLLDRIKSKIPDSDHIFKTFLIPVLVVACVLLVGVGGTYVIAANVLNPGYSNEPSKISQSDLASTVESAPTSTPIPKALPVVLKPTPVSNITPTPTTDPAAGWTPYTFSALSLNFSYPPGWFVNVPATSGAPYFYVQNFSGSIPTSFSPGQFSILISRLEQVGITTVSSLTTQLALNAASSVTLNGVNMGQVSVISSTPTIINGYQALVRTVIYSASPSAQMNETYILDGVSNVVEFVPLLDTSYGQSYFNTLLSTVEFTN